MSARQFSISPILKLGWHFSNWHPFRVFTAQENDASFHLEWKWNTFEDCVDASNSYLRTYMFLSNKNWKNLKKLVNFIKKFKYFNKFRTSLVFLFLFLEAFLIWSKQIQAINALSFGIIMKIQISLNEPSVFELFIAIKSIELYVQVWSVFDVYECKHKWLNSSNS